ncbi:MAG: gamma-glutamyltransferase, partial [Thermoplasmatota archaeon]
MIEYDPLKYPYTSKRKLVYSKRGMVCATQPLAAQAGLDILKKGGNAVDAAIATAACLTVVEPTSNGLGGDAFTLFWKDGELHGLNSSGPSPRSISIEKIKEFGHEDMPKYGWPTVTVPGIPGSWAELSKKHGELPLIDVLQPAIDYAREGYPVSPTVGKYWKFAFRAYKQLEGEQYKHWFDTFALEGRAPDIGEMWRSEDHAKTLEEIGSTEAESFYRGKLADKIAEFSKEYNGFVHKEDLEDYSPEWVEPMNVDYRGYDIWELPPNGQGVVALMALKILNDMESEGIDNVETIQGLFQPPLF